MATGSPDETLALEEHLSDVGLEYRIACYKEEQPQGNRESCLSVWTDWRMQRAS